MFEKDPKTWEQLMLLMSDYADSPKMCIRDRFLGWLIAFHGEAKVLSPDWVSQRMRELAEQVLENQ